MLETSERRRPSGCVGSWFNGDAAITVLTGVSSVGKLGASIYLRQVGAKD
jgi:hypothetical protein